LRQNSVPLSHLAQLTHQEVRFLSPDISICPKKIKQILLGFPGKFGYDRTILKLWSANCFKEDRMINASLTRTDESFLASTEELISLLGKMATPATRHSANRRRDARLAQEALSQFVPSPVEEPQTARSGRGGRGEKRDDPDRVRRRQFCKCGECKWCVENARWERIFNEKFCDPTYYGPLQVRRNSTLATAF
jgi:hypothetical protein